MSERLTPEWTQTLEEAFGSSGAWGRKGELWLLAVVKQWGYDTIDYENDIKCQLRGHDIAIRKSSWKRFYTIDVKNNIRKDKCFYVDTSVKGWLLNPKRDSDRIWHVNPVDGLMAWYDRKDMIDVIQPLENTGNFNVEWCDNRFNFIEWRDNVHVPIP